ncbi:MAG: hypothetical protein HZC41_03910 [Chloroflexi bacterium]|nr:hypothetical protein [Chloroflexota bacterium]
MFNAGLAVLSTIISWVVLVLTIVALTVWRGDVFFGGSYTLLQGIMVLALIGALIQTRFLLKHIRLSQPEAETTDKRKRRPKHELVDMVNTLDERERAELYALLDEQVEGYSDYRSR